jgi:hypothetical protein
MMWFSGFHIAYLYVLDGNAFLGNRAARGGAIAVRRLRLAR